MDKQENCSYCNDHGQFSTQCPTNPHKNTRCTKFGKTGYDVSTSFSKGEKQSKINVAHERESKDEKEQEQGDDFFDGGGQVTVIIDDTNDDEFDRAVFAVERGVHGQPRQKSQRRSAATEVDRLLNPRSQPPQKISERRKLKKRGSQ